MNSIEENLISIYNKTFSSEESIKKKGTEIFSTQHLSEIDNNYSSERHYDSFFRFKYRLILKRLSLENPTIELHLYKSHTQEQLKARLSLLENGKWKMNVLFKKNIKEGANLWEFIKEPIQLLSEKVSNPKEEGEIRKSPIGYSHKRLRVKKTNSPCFLLYDKAVAEGHLPKEYKKTALDFKLPLIYTRSKSKSYLKRRPIPSKKTN